MKNGLTLIELIIAVGLISILIGAVWVIYGVGLNAFGAYWARAGIKTEVGRAFINIARELRQATSVIDAKERNLRFSVDTDDDGIDEIIQYNWSGLRGAPLNRISKGTIAVAGSVDKLLFSFYGVNNNFLISPINASQVKLAALDLIVVDKNEIFHLRLQTDLRNI